MAAGYTRGMVVNADVPRLDATRGWKEHPVLIVSTEDFHRTRPDDLIEACLRRALGL